MIDKDKITRSLNTFFNDKRNGAKWQDIVFDAPAFAMERIAIAMYHSVYGPTMDQAAKEEYRAMREEVDGRLRREDLEYLIKVMPENKKGHYKALLSLMPKEDSEPQA